MKTIQETLETPVIDEYDVIVVGGGPAGVGAALGAAQAGRKTLLIEQYAFLGGMWTAGDYSNLGLGKQRRYYAGNRRRINGRKTHCLFRPAAWF